MNSKYHFSIQVDVSEIQICDFYHYFGVNWCYNMYTADNTCKMIEFLIDNIVVQSGGRLFCQAIGIPMGTNCAPLLAGLFLYSYENKFLDNMIRSGHRRLGRLFNLCYRYIDDLIVFNNKAVWYICDFSRTSVLSCLSISFSKW